MLPWPPEADTLEQRLWIYTYLDGNIYILSEGGEKFVHIILNPRTSLAVYEDYQGMDKLVGMQITGRASLMEESHSMYRDVSRAKGLSPEKL